MKKKMKIDGKINFKPQAKKLLVEQVPNEDAVKIIDPNTGNNAVNVDDMSIFVRAVGPKVEGFKAGDRIMMSVHDCQRVGTFNVGVGKRLYGIVEEKDVFGTFDD